jgi:hypothetical protein
MGTTAGSHQREWTWQRDVGGATARTKAFKEQALAGSLRVFAFMQPGNRFVNVFHSATVFFDPLAGNDAALKTIAFVGNRTAGQGCIPVALKPEKPRSWPGISRGVDEVEFETFYAEQTSRDKWYHPEGLR